MSNESLIFGIHAVRTALQNSGDVRCLMVVQGRDDRRVRELLDMAAVLGVAVEEVSRAEIERLAGRERHQGVLAYIRSVPTLDFNELLDLLDNLEQPPLLLVLDGVQDPHNLGACLRSADAAGVHAVLVPKDRAVGLTPVAVKAACGAASTIPLVVVTNLARALEQLQARGIWVTGFAGETDALLYDADFSGPCALVLGNEGDGLRRLTRESCDYLVKIPMLGRVESLNVSVAAGIALFEAVRQRRDKK